MPVLTPLRTPVVFLVIIFIPAWSHAAENRWVHTEHPVERVLAAGPSPGFSSRGCQKPEGGVKNQKEVHIFKIQYWMYVTNGGPNVKWGGTDFKWGRAPLAPRWRRPWLAVKSSAKCKRLILQLPTVTPSSTQLWPSIPVILKVFHIPPYKLKHCEFLPNKDNCKNFTLPTVKK